MIKTKRELIEYINSDNSWAKSSNFKWSFINIFTNNPYRFINKYLFYLRLQEYYINTANGNKIKGFLSLLYERKKNRLGNKLGFEIPPNCFGKGLCIYHIGTIIVNPKARIGEYCQLHGNNCLGNNGNTDDCPVIGKNVDIGFGAVVIGNVQICDNVYIGANAVVNKSFFDSNITLVGVPARKK